MMFLLFFTTGIGCMLLQSSIFPLLPEWTGRPDLLFLLLIFIGLRLPLYTGLCVVILLALCYELTAGVLLGIYPALYTLLFLLLKILSQKLVVDQPIYQPALTVVCYLLTCGGLYLCNSILSPGIHLTWSWQATLLGGIMLAILSLPAGLLFQVLLSLLPSARKRGSQSPYYS